jgi:hypothetical protein
MKAFSMASIELRLSSGSAINHASAWSAIISLNKFNLALPSIFLKLV